MSFTRALSTFLAALTLSACAKDTASTGESSDDADFASTGGAADDSGAMTESDEGATGGAEPGESETDSQGEDEEAPFSFDDPFEPTGHFAYRIRYQRTFEGEYSYFEFDDIEQEGSFAGLVMDGTLFAEAVVREEGGALLGFGDGVSTHRFMLGLDEGSETPSDESDAVEAGMNGTLFFYSRTFVDEFENRVDTGGSPISGTLRVEHCPSVALDDPLAPTDPPSPENQIRFSVRGVQLQSAQGSFAGIVDGDFVIGITEHDGSRCAD